MASDAEVFTGSLPRVLCECPHLDVNIFTPTIFHNIWNQNIGFYIFCNRLLQDIYRAQKLEISSIKNGVMPRPDICHEYHELYSWRKKCQKKMEKFQLSMYGKCGEIENFSTCGEISDVSTWQMWRNLKLCVQFIVCFVAKTFLRITLFCREILLSRFTRYCVEKTWAKKCARGEKWQIWGMH